jgi:putative endonuclease
MITVYVLQGSRNRKRYVGITNDLPRRLAEHRSGRTKGGQVIGAFRVVLTELFPDHKSARVRERYLKSGQGREWLNHRLAGRGPPAADEAAP